MARRKNLTIINASLSFDEEDVEVTEAWWEDQRYSPAPLEEKLIDAALAGMVSPDIEDVRME